MLRTVFLSPGLVLAVFLSAASAEMRIWSDRSGRAQVKAEYVGFSVNQVMLRPPKGEVFTVPIDKLDEADRHYVNQRVRQKLIRDDALYAAAAQNAICYGRPRQVAVLDNEAIDESSGIACSRRTPGVFWTHNDSGDDPRIYAFDTEGRDLGSCLLSGVEAYDWEDIASFTWQGRPYLLVADTGNNGLASAVQMLHLLEEPPVDPEKGVIAEKVRVVQTIYFSYEDDHRNCEAVAVDPRDRTIVLATKQPGEVCFIYTLAWPKTPSPPKTALVARRIASPELPPVTAMDISPGGRRAVLLTYQNAYVFTRADEHTWSAAFAQPPREVPMPDRLQGESITYGPDGRALYLTSEKLPTPLLEILVEADRCRSPCHPIPSNPSGDQAESAHPESKPPLHCPAEAARARRPGLIGVPALARAAPGNAPLRSARSILWMREKQDRLSIVLRPLLCNVGVPLQRWGCASAGAALAVGFRRARR